MGCCQIQYIRFAAFSNGELLIILSNWHKSFNTKSGFFNSTFPSSAFPYYLVTRFIPYTTIIGLGIPQFSPETYCKSAFSSLLHRPTPSRLHLFLKASSNLATYPQNYELHIHCLSSSLFPSFLSTSPPSFHTSPCEIQLSPPSSHNKHFVKNIQWFITFSFLHPSCTRVKTSWRSLLRAEEK